MKGQYIKAGGSTESWWEAKRQACIDIASECELRSSARHNAGMISVKYLTMKPSEFKKALLHPGIIYIH